MAQIAGVVTLIAGEGKEDALIALLTQMHVEAAKDEGCDVYSFMRLKREPRTFVLVEFYRDKAGFATHRANPAWAALGPALQELIESMTVQLGDVAGGDTVIRAGS